MCAPLFLSTGDHGKQGLLLFLLIRIPILGACLRRSLSPLMSTTSGVFFYSFQEKTSFIVLAFASHSLHRRSRQMGYSPSPIMKNFYSLFSCASLILSAGKHEKWILILFLWIIFPVHRACTCLLFSSCTSTANGVFLSYS